MSADAADLLQEVGLPGTATTLAAPGYTVGDTTINVDSTTNWPTNTGVSYAMDLVDTNGDQIAGSYCEFVGKVTGGTSIASVSRVFGVPQDYPAGITTRVYVPVSSERENRLVQWGIEQHHQDGTHADVTADSLSSTNGLNVAGGTVTLPAGSVPPNFLKSGTGTDWGYKTWNPTFNGFTPGAATIVARYREIGTFVHAYMIITGAADSAITGVMQVSLPVNANANAVVGRNNIGGCEWEDAGVDNWPGMVLLANASTAQPLYLVLSGGSKINWSGTTPNVPFDFKLNDTFGMSIMYERVA